MVFQIVFRKLIACMYWYWWISFRWDDNMHAVDSTKTTQRWALAGKQFLVMAMLFRNKGMHIADTSFHIIRCCNFFSLQKVQQRLFLSSEYNIEFYWMLNKHGLYLFWSFPFVMCIHLVPIMPICCTENLQSACGFSTFLLGGWQLIEWLPHG